MYPSSALLGKNKDETVAALPVDDLIEKADGFAGVFPGITSFFPLKFYVVFRNIYIMFPTFNNVTSSYSGPFKNILERKLDSPDQMALTGTVAFSLVHICINDGLFS